MKETIDRIHSELRDLKHLIWLLAPYRDLDGVRGEIGQYTTRVQQLNEELEGLKEYSQV